MIPVLLIAIPLVGGLAGFFIKNEKSARSWSLFVSLAALAVSLWGLSLPKNSPMLNADLEWLPALGSRFAVGLDGMGQILCLLTAIAFPVIFIATWRDERRLCKPASRLATSFSAEDCGSTALNGNSGSALMALHRNKGAAQNPNSRKTSRHRSLDCPHCRVKVSLLCGRAL